MEVLLCEIDGQALVMQFRALVEVPLCEIGGHVVWSAGGGAVLRDVDGPVRGGMQFRVLVEVPLCEIGGM